jgi:HAD superfamily hydrolase (TIGR01509 family)
MNFVFDLDGCLYEADEDQIRKNIHEYIKQPVDTSRNAYLDLIDRNIQFDEDDYWQFIRWNEIIIKPKPEVVEFIKALGSNCWIFTNCREKEAIETLVKLEIDPSLFKGIFGIDFTKPHCKPDMEAFQKVKNAIGGDCTFFDDNDANLKSAKICGFKVFKLCSINDS